MATENKGIMLAKSMQKHAGRAKEKILQNLGKVDRTADEIFDDHLNNFNRQQSSASKLQKEFNNYIRCIRAAQTASKSLMDAISEVYEPQWTGFDALQAQTAASESLWQDFAHKLGDQVLIPLNTYTGQFPEMKKKVEKRNRKLIDYDGQRHSFQSLQANANKRKDDVKLTKGREQLEEARRTYEILNTELHDELPALYDSRILFLVTNLQTLFATEQVFHSETSKIYAELEAIVDRLATDSQRGSNTLRKQTVNAIKSPSPVPSPVKQVNNSNSNYQNQITANLNGNSNVNSPTSSSSDQEPRLDSVSPTPETTPEIQQASTPISSTSSPATSVKEPSYQNAAIAQAVVASSVTTKTTTTTTTVENNVLNSENSNIATADGDDSTTTKTTIEEKTTTLNGGDVNETAAAKATITGNETTTKVTENATAAAAAAANDAALNNIAKINANNTTTQTSITATTTTTTKVAKVTPQIPTEQLNGNDNGNGNAITPTTKATTESATGTNNGNVEDNQKKSIDASNADLPPGVLYRVKSTYGYVKEDVDELSFEIGDIIRVIEYDDPEDQEEGWLMGQKEGTNEKGLFPANFTRPV